VSRYQNGEPQTGSLETIGPISDEVQSSPTPRVWNGAPTKANRASSFDADQFLRWQVRPPPPAELYASQRLLSVGTRSVHVESSSEPGRVLEVEIPATLSNAASVRQALTACDPRGHVPSTPHHAETVEADRDGIGATLRGAGRRGAAVGPHRAVTRPRAEPAGGQASAAALR